MSIQTYAFGDRKLRQVFALANVWRCLTFTQRQNIIGLIRPASVADGIAKRELGDLQGHDGLSRDEHELVVHTLENEDLNLFL